MDLDLPVPGEDTDLDVLLKRIPDVRDVVKVTDDVVKAAQLHSVVAVAVVAAAVVAEH